MSRRRVAGTIEAAVSESLAALDSQPVDRGAVALALKYAQTLDDDEMGDQLPKVGPQLLAVLEALSMTPRARAALPTKGSNGAGNRSKLDELRARRDARLHDAASVDAAAP